MHTDVLIVGGGGAGLLAACVAREAGARVTLVTKSRAGWANSTAYAGGGFAGAYGSVTPEQHRKKTLEIGRQINVPHMVDVMCETAAARVEQMQRFGVKLDMRDGGASVARYGLNPLLGGSGMTLPLTEYARRVGVEFVESTIVTGLFVDDNRCLGVRALGARTGEFSSIAARATIVATGGAGRLYSRTDNPVRTTGDGFALLAELGLPFIDMEFMQFYPMGFAERSAAVHGVPLYLVPNPVITDENGNEFLKRLWDEWGIHNGNEANSYARDRCSIAIAREWARGGEVLFHAELIDPEVWTRGLGKSLLKHFPDGRTPADGPVRVKPLQHYFPGGAYVTPGCMTEIPGLLACGEVTGGTDGANRIGGNALSMITVHGFEAAEAALACIGLAASTSLTPSAAPARPAAQPFIAAHALPNLPDSHPADDYARIWRATGEGSCPQQFKRRINQIADAGVFVIRNDAGLRHAIDGFAELEASLAEMRAPSPEELLEAYEARNLVTVGKMVARAALARTESRGVHYRDDYPAEDEAWLGHVELRSVGGSLRVRRVPVDPRASGPEYP